MKYMRGVVITGQNTLAVSDRCPLPEKLCPTGALIRPLIWSPCTSDAPPVRHPGVPLCLTSWVRR